MRRTTLFGSNASWKLALVHLALIVLVTVAMVTTLPTNNLHV